MKDIFMIETPRLMLREYTPEIMQEAFKTIATEDLVSWLGLKEEREVEKEKANLENGVKTYKTSFLYFHLIEKDSGLNIGWCGYHMWFTEHDRAEIGYVMTNESYRNQGYMKEALPFVLKYGLQEMGLRRIEALTSHENEISKKLLINNGFEYESVLKGHYKVNGVMEDSVMYALLN